MSTQEIDAAIALLARYPYDPKADPSKYPEGSPERLRGVPPGMREPLAAIYVRSRSRWQAEAKEFDLPETHPGWYPGAKSEDFLGSKWDTQNCILRAEWRALYARLNELEMERGRKFSGDERMNLLQAFRKRLMRSVGATDVDPAWEEWQEHLDREFPERTKRGNAGTVR